MSGSKPPRRPDPPVPQTPKEEKDTGYGPSHGNPPGHGGPSGPGDAPALNERHDTPDIHPDDRS